MKKDLRKKNRVLIAMSGGVDSSVSAFLLKEQGYEVVGMTMQVWDYSRPESDIQEGFGTCCSSLDVADARAVCQKLNIPFYVLNCEAMFKEKVIDKFTNSYLKGQTPVPCVDCNTYLKFDLLIQKMKELECNYLATGHYARRGQTAEGLPAIYKSADDWKDQTYFLFTVPAEMVSCLLFPVGEMDKQQVRKIAEEKGLPVFNKKDSTGLCFIGSEGYAGFIRKQIKKEGKKTPPFGPIKLYPSADLIGRHTGLYQFTYGQRKGLGVSSADKPLYVIKTDFHTNTLWLGEEKFLYKDKALVQDLHWLDEPSDGQQLKVKIRFHHSACQTRLYKKQDHCILEFETPQKAVTPGQAAVFYKGEQLVGGGSIATEVIGKSGI